VTSAGRDGAAMTMSISASIVGSAMPARLFEPFWEVA
jgi:hypothetical protein